MYAHAYLKRKDISVKVECSTPSQEVRILKEGEGLKGTISSLIPIKTRDGPPNSKVIAK